MTKQHRSRFLLLRKISSSEQIFRRAGIISERFRYNPPVLHAAVVQCLNRANIKVNRIQKFCSGRNHYLVKTKKIPLSHHICLVDCGKILPLGEERRRTLTKPQN